MQRIKCVAVGDTGVGKTSLLQTYASNVFPDNYVPTVFSNSAKYVTIDSKPVILNLWDTAGQEEYERLRPLSYPGADVFLFCFSILNFESLVAIISKWLPEVRKYMPDTPFILVACKCDLHNNEVITCLNEQIVTSAQGLKVAMHINANGYVECSALHQKNLSEVFDKAIRIALKSQITLKDSTYSNNNNNNNNNIKKKDKLSVEKINQLV